MDGHGLGSDIPENDLSIVATSEESGVGEGVESSRSDCGLAETVEFCPGFESWVPEENQADVVLDAAFLIL